MTLSEPFVPASSVPVVLAWREAFMLLRLKCPFCGQRHYHCDREADAMVMARCWPRDLPPHLRGLPLRYRLAVVPGSLRGKRKVLPFAKRLPKRTVASDDAMTPEARALFAEMDKRDKALQAILKRIAAAAKHHGLPEVLRCRCGAVLHDPSDPATIAEHAPHLPPLREVRTR